MAKALLYQLDGKIPNIALMRASTWLKERGHEVELRWSHNVEPQLWDSGEEIVMASLLFEKTRHYAEDLLVQWPQAIVGGTGWDLTTTLEDYDIDTMEQDYSIYPKCEQSIGFTQRGCRLRCDFCVVSRKEGKVRTERTVEEIWRGDPWPRELILLDNDFFGQPDWRARITEIQAGGFKVNFNQGINARFLTEEAARAVASVDYRDAAMKVKRIYTAWDNLKDEKRLFAGLERLVKYGVKPDHIMVYLLVGYWAGETMEGNLHRARKLREFGARPYPMPYERTQELVGFQRWLVGAYDKRIPWDEWVRAEYQPYRLGAGVEADG